MILILYSLSDLGFMIGAIDFLITLDFVVLFSLQYLSSLSNSSSVILHPIGFLHGLSERGRPSETEFGIIIEGDSMEPTFKNGKVIFVKKLNNCDYNDYGIFCITENDITKVVFKKRYY